MYRNVSWSQKCQNQVAEPSSPIKSKTKNKPKNKTKKPHQIPWGLDMFWFLNSAHCQDKWKSKVKISTPMLRKLQLPIPHTHHHPPQVSLWLTTLAFHVPSSSVASLPLLQTSSLPLPFSRCYEISAWPSSNAFGIILFLTICKKLQEYSYHFQLLLLQCGVNLLLPRSGKHKDTLYCGLSPRQGQRDLFS